VGEEGGKLGKVELGVMVIGGASAMKGKIGEEKEITEVRMGRGEEVLKTDAFWDDLKGFLTQRLKDEGEGERVWGVFKGAIDK